MSNQQYYGHHPPDHSDSMPYSAAPGTLHDTSFDLGSAPHADAYSQTHHQPQYTSIQDPYDYYPAQSEGNAPSAHVPGSSHLYRQPTQSTVSPWDSVSNYPQDELAHASSSASRAYPGSGIGQYHDANYLSADPYAQHPRTSYHPSPYDEHEQEDIYHGKDTSAMPLVTNAAMPADSTASRSHTPYDQQYDLNEENKYPPSKLRDSRADGANILDELEQARENRPPWWLRQFRDTTPTDDKIAYRQQGIGVQKRPWFCWTLTVGMIVALVIIMVKQDQATGTPIAIKPTFNPMIGPSSEVLIQNGARFTPCMKETTLIDEAFSCPNATSSTSTVTCSLEEICGFGGFHDKDPSQTFRFALPIMLHAGVVHLILNGLVQCLTAAQAEREMGSLRFAILYISAGIFGFILSSNFSLIGIPSVGASGALFGIYGCMLVDLGAHWKLERSPKKKLAFVLIEMIIGIGLGFIPFIDNFCHIGGFAMGLLMAILLYPAIHQTKRHRYIFYGLRCVAVVGVILLFVLLIKNFHTVSPDAACSWCRYLSCWPTSSNNHCKGTGLTTTETSSSSSFAPVLTLLGGHFARKYLSR